MFDIKKSKSEINVNVKYLCLKYFLSIRCIGEN